MRAIDCFERFSHLLAEFTATDFVGNCLGMNEAVEQMIDLMRKAIAQGRKLLFIGNGGSASIASHQAMDYWKSAGLRALAFNDGSLLTCISNDYGYPHVFEKPVQMFAEPGDVLVAISSSGRSPSILNGVKAGRQRNCAVITLSGFSSENDLRRLGDINFYVPSDNYGHVEIAHLTILHCALDIILNQTAEFPPHISR